jgi:hypothetical protein
MVREIYEHKPYTYLIGWSSLDQWYYGVRFAKGCNPDDFWVTYFTSSNRVKNLRKNIGEPDVIEIRRTFDSSNKARLWESKVLRRINAPNSKMWLNQTDNGSKFYHEGPRGSFTAEHKEKMAMAKRGKHITKEHHEKLLASRRGKKNSPEHTAAIVESRLNTHHTDATKKKMSEKRKAYCALKFPVENKKIVHKAGSDEHINNLSLKAKENWNNKTTEEQLAINIKISQAVKAYWANKKKGGS